MAMSSYRISRLFSSSFSRYLTNTTAFVQNGPKIREVPLVIRRLLDESRKTFPLQIHKAPAWKEVDNELLQRIDNLPNTKSLISLLETLKSTEVTPFIAYFALKKLVHFTQTGKDDMMNCMDEGFTRHAFIKRLLEIIVVEVQKDPEVLIDGLQLAALELETSMDPMDAIAFRRRMYEESLISMTDGNLKPCQIARAVCIISEYFPDKGEKFRETDKFWPGILDKSEEITAGNISTVCKVLPHLKKSRDIVIRTIEMKLEETFREIDTASALEILGILTSIDDKNRRMLQCLSKWLSLSIQRLSEKELGAFIYCFSSLEYSSSCVENTLERYIKAKGVRIQDRELMSAISDYTLKFRLRNQSILEGISEYFMAHGKSFNPCQIHSVARIFGELNYHPPNGFKFFEILEHALSEHFNSLSPIELLNLLVSAVYIEIYPLNFIERVTSKGFMKRCAQLSPSEKTEVDNLLRLLESGIRMGVKGYERFPSWRPNSYQYVSRNFRVGRTAKKILGPLGKVIGGMDRLNLDVVLSSLPLTPLYIIDLMIYPSAVAKFSRFGRETKNNMNTAVIIHPPEHYDSKGETLLGMQATRIRHLRKMEFRIMELDMRKIYAHSRSEGKELQNYLKDCFDKSQLELN